MTDDISRHDTETEYEKNQRFNFLVSYLHSFRYRNILTLFKAIARETGGKPIRVIDIGCAHAKLFSVLNESFDIDYTGIEITNALESIVIYMRQYGHEMQKNFGRSQARSWGASGDAAASRQGDS